MRQHSTSTASGWDRGRVPSIGGMHAVVAILGLLVCVAMAPSRGAAASAGEGAPTAALPGALAQDPSTVREAAIDRAYLIGSWETRNMEFGRDVQVIWTVRSDGSLDYDFVIDGVASRGSKGTWNVHDGVLTENWVRPDGSTGTGRANIEKIDDQTFRLTVIDNGAPGYGGVVRIYKRLPSPQTVRLRSARLAA